MRNSYIALAVIVAALFACSKEEELSTDPPGEHVNPGDTTTSAVNSIPEELPYPKLSDYNFFQGEMKNMEPQERVLPYELISSLFTDYAHKKRFVWMPEGSSANYNGDGNILEFGDGAILIKNFYYDNVQPGNSRRIIETRLMYKINGEWFFANYVWNDEQTEAFMDLNGSDTPVQWIDENNNTRSIDYRIPSETECLTCHKTSDLPVPIGPKPQNLSKIFSYQDGEWDQLAKWENMGYLQPGYPIEINATVAWDDLSQSLSNRVRSYVDINCGHCHKESSHCDYRPIRFAFEETTIPENMGVCVEPDEFVNGTLTHIIAPGNHERSMAYFRMNATDESVRMPLLGRTIVHDEGVELMKEYINSLEDPC